MTTLVVGATGATGRFVVRQMLERGRQVRAVARSREKMLSLVPSALHAELEVVEASLLDMSDADIAEHVRGCDSVVCCLGHSITFKGMCGSPRYLVRDSVRRLCGAIEAAKPDTPVKFVLMSTDGANNPDRSDPARPFADRAAISLVRLLLGPHRDNERAASHVSKKVGTSNPYIEWTAVRPGNLIDAEVSPYKLYASPPVSAIFGYAQTTRANVAHVMCELVTDNELWQTWKAKFPVIHNTTAKTEK